jgi:tetratricopeptide (TPR) repeat protein
MKEAVYGTMPGLAGAAEDYFVIRGPLRAAVAARLRRLVGPAPVRRLRMATLDAAAAFERGLAAFEQMEYAAAREAFVAAADLDTRQPLPLAWSAYVAALMRQDKDAADSASRALGLLTADTPANDRHFVEAVAAETRRDAAAAEARYRDLLARRPDEPQRILLLAAFLDRQGRATDAVTTYHDALARDETLVAPHVELCRLYSPSRLNEPATARAHGEQALAGYRALQNLAGEVQARWCLTDVLRAGSAEERKEARRHAETALDMVQQLGYPYALARAFNYVANVALLAERNAGEAVPLYEQALASARGVGNVVVESRVLMNLGAAHETLGQPATAIKYYRESFNLFEALGNQQEAAWSQVNGAAILIDYGVDPQQGLRDAQNALAVFQKIGDTYFEVFARRMIASYYRHTARIDDARRELTLAHSVAVQRNLDDRVAQTNIELARLHVDSGEYLDAERALEEALRGASGVDAIHARIELSRVRTRLGRFDDAARDLRSASDEIDRAGDHGSRPLLFTALGEEAYEAGRIAEARQWFARAAALGQGRLPEPASIEASAYAGFLDATGGKPAAGRAAIEASLAAARRMRFAALEARCLLLLARALLASGDARGALAALGVLTGDRAAALSPEVRIQLHHWRGDALSRIGNEAQAAVEAGLARESRQKWEATIPAAVRAQMMKRADVRTTTQSF